jgi:hypothetical protein
MNWFFTGEQPTPQNALDSARARALGYQGLLFIQYSGLSNLKSLTENF